MSKPEDRTGREPDRYALIESRTRPSSGCALPVARGYASGALYVAESEKRRSEIIRLCSILCERALDKTRAELAEIGACLSGSSDECEQYGAPLGAVRELRQLFFDGLDPWTYRTG